MNRQVVLPWVLWAAIVLMFAGLVAYCGKAHGEPIAVANGETMTITLFNEPCDLKEVSNLKQKAEWREGEKTFHGCWRFHPLGIVVIYFLEDKTIAIVPAQSFAPATGT